MANLTQSWRESVWDQNVSSNVRVLLESALLVVPPTWNIPCAMLDTIRIPCNSSRYEVIDMVRDGALCDSFVAKIS